MKNQSAHRKTDRFSFDESSFIDDNNENITTEYKILRDLILV